MRDLIIDQVEKYLLFKLRFSEKMKLLDLVDSFMETRKSEPDFDIKILD